MDIQQKTILVSGGGSGLGQATAERLANEGANVVIVDIDQVKGAAVAQALGVQAIFAAADVTDETSVPNAIVQAQAHFGALHGAVNCAGIASGERITGKRGPHRLDSFAKVITANLIGSFNVLRLAATAMSPNEPGPDGERGVIINTASVAAYDGQIGQAAYAASKGGIVGLTLPPPLVTWPPTGFASSPSPLASLIRGSWPVCQKQPAPVWVSKSLFPAVWVNRQNTQRLSATSLPTECAMAK